MSVLLVVYLFLAILCVANCIDFSRQGKDALRNDTWETQFSSDVIVTVGIFLEQAFFHV